MNLDHALLTEFFRWCTVINLGILILWSVIWLFMPKLIYSTHQKWFPLSKEAIGSALYYFFGAFKIFFIVFNLVPYVVLRFLM